MNRISSLADQKFRILGLAISITAILLLVLLRLLNYQYEESWQNRIFIINHFIIIFGLFMIMYSKEVYDDQRVQIIRYALLKLTYALTICGILVYVSITTLDRVELSIFVILNIIEAVLIIYQLLFRYYLLKNPDWIFKQKTQQNSRFYILAASLLFLLGWIIYCVIQFKT